MFEQAGDQHGASRARQMIASLRENATGQP